MPGVRRLLISQTEDYPRRMIRDVFIAGLWAVGLMSVLFMGGSIFPALIWLVALYPGMRAAQALFSVLPTSLIETLMNNLGVDEAPAVYVGMSVVCAFLFWWLCAFVGLKVRAHLLKNRGAGRMASAGRLR